MIDINDPVELAKALMLTLHEDLPRLIRIDNYLHDHSDDPYTPDSAGAEYRLLAARSKTNLMPLVVDASAQGLYVDSVRPGRKVPEADEDGAEAFVLPEWVHWQGSRLDGRQIAVHRGALSYGHSFTVTEKRNGKTRTKGLSALNTSAIFEDPANDETPLAAFSVTDWPKATNKSLGTARMWNDTTEFEVTFQLLSDTENIVIEEIGPHGSKECPITRFAARIDLEGRTMGVVEPLLILQDRINQTVFDMLVVQSGSAFKVRTVTGMAPPYKMTYEIAADGSKKLVPLLDPDTQMPVLADIEINAMKLLYAENKETKFGTLDETPLDGYLAAIEDCIKLLSAISQTPPFFLIGAIANLSADALQAAMTALERKIAEFRNVFGESWERVFRLAAELEGIPGAMDDYDTEVIWRDTQSRVLAPIADGIGKLVQAGAPIEGLLDLLPGMTQNMKREWLEMMANNQEKLEEQDAKLALASSQLRNRNARSIPAPAATPAAPAA